MNIDIKKIIANIDKLIPYARRETKERLINLQKYLFTENCVTQNVRDEYKRCEMETLHKLPISKEKILAESLFPISTEDLNYSKEEYLSRIQKLEYMYNRLMERPRIFERRAEEKLEEIDSKFRSLMNVVDKGRSISDQIRQVDQLENKLNKLGADAQEMLRGISTVQLGKHYLEAKNKYCYCIQKLKFSNSKKRYIVFVLNILSSIRWVCHFIFQQNFFLYLGFISSLLLLTLTYMFLIMTKNTSYTDFILTVPMLWSAWFFQRKINTREKLFEIYNHKQNVMETYVAFKNGDYTLHIEDKLEDVLLDVIKKDPSDCIGKDNTTIVESMLDRLKGIFEFEKMKRSIKEMNNTK